MASPHAESFYCISSKSIDGDARTAYGALAIGCASLGLLGSLYQVITLRKFLNLSRKRRPSPNPNIIFFLALSDLTACLAVIMRSAMLLLIEAPHENGNGELVPQSQLVVDIGAPLQALVQAAFLATYMWTFCYALDVYLQSRRLGSWNYAYHVVSWLVPIWLTGFSEFMLFYDVGFPCASGIRLTVSHMCTYVPIVFVMLVNPMLYIMAYVKVRSDLRQQGVMGAKQHDHLSRVLWKFSFFVIVYWICWLPSVATGFYIHVLNKGSDDFPLILWLLTALLNPLQGFFNCFIYGVGRDFKNLVNLGIAEPNANYQRPSGGSSRTQSESSYSVPSTPNTHGVTTSILASGQHLKPPKSEGKPGENSPLLRRQ